MSKDRVRTIPNLADTSLKHQEAIKLGTDHFFLESRNVADHYKHMPTEDIRKDLQSKAYPFAVCMENWLNDFNFSSLIRNANGMGAKEVFYVGDKKYDKRGAQGTYNYTDVTFLPTVDDLVKLKNDYLFIGIDNVSGSVSLPTYTWPKEKVLMIFGSEGTGLTPTVLSMCKDLVSLPMIGSVRSYNCSSTSLAVMYDYVSKFSRA